MATKKGRAQDHDRKRPGERKSTLVLNQAIRPRLVDARPATDIRALAISSIRSQVDDRGRQKAQDRRLGGSYALHPEWPLDIMVPSDRIIVGRSNNYSNNYMNPGSGERKKSMQVHWRRGIARRHPFRCRRAGVLQPGMGSQSSVSHPCGRTKLLAAAATPFDLRRDPVRMTVVER